MSLLSLAKGNPARILEIGCGRGQSLLYFKQQRGAVYTAGVEYVEDVAAIAREEKGLDHVISGDVESLNLSHLGKFDLIIAGHVLEHVKDPWAVTRRLQALLNPDGQFIGSLPNVRHIKVSLPLLVFGKWEYQEEGILDWTHTKFFTKDTIRELLSSSGFVIDKIVPEFAPRAVFANRATLGAFQNLLAWTYNFSAFPATGKPHLTETTAFAKDK